MGSYCGCTEAIKQEDREDITRKFDKFDFRINPDDEFTFIQRAKRELAGNGAPMDFMLMLYEGFRKFMIKTACAILAWNKTGGKKYFIGPYTAAPLIDEMWCLAILYSSKYMELCEILVGGFIDRKPPNSLNGINITRLIWEDYTLDFWRLDSKYTIWIYNSDLKEMLNNVYSKIMSYKNENKIHVPKYKLNSQLKGLRRVLEKKALNIDLTRPAMKIPDSHKYYNPDAKESLQNVYKNIKSQLPLNLSKIFRRKYCVGEKSSDYIKEYARFMTMLYFTNNPLTPSEEVDQVWHTHQCMTIEYRNFCRTIFGKFIYHIPTVGGELESTKHVNLYDKTINFYCFLFKESPPIGLWPTTEDRFNPEKFIGSWFSLARLYQSVLRFIEMHKETKPDDILFEILTCYFSWTGKNMFKGKNYKINLRLNTNLKSGCSKSDYWLAGGCSVIMGLGYTTGCETGCGGGCSSISENQKSSRFGAVGSKRKNGSRSGIRIEEVGMSLGIGALFLLR